MSGKFLDKAYDLDGVEKTQAYYDAWADSYDAEIAENGYATPLRCAEALWAERPEPDMPILDYGCGTGLSALALRRVGYTVIDGMDPSAEMLQGARDKGAYRALEVLDLDDPSPVAKGRYPAIAAIGVIGTGAAPAATFDLLMQALERGGLLVFSLNDHALADAAYTGRLNQWLDCGAARLLSKEYGDHLPGQNLNSNVYVIEKA